MQRNAPQLIFTAGLNVAALKTALDKENIETSNLGTNKLSDQMHDAYILGIHIHQMLLDIAKTELPPMPDSKATFLIPPILLSTISWMLSNGEQFTLANKYVDTEEGKKTKMLSICQEILYTARNVRILTPKHVSMAMAIQKVTGRNDLVAVLNGYGHIVSSSKLQKIEAAVGEVCQGEGGGIISPKIDKYIPVFLCLITMISMKRVHQVMALHIVPTVLLYSKKCTWVNQKWQLRKVDLSRIH